MKVALIAIVGFLAAVVLLSALAPNEFKIEREIVINQPKQQVFEQLRFLRNHEQWNAWTQLDPNMKKEFRGEDGSVGFVSSWESEHNEVGTAEQEITKIVDGERFETVIRFKKPFEADFDSYLVTTDMGQAQTKVVLGMYDEMSFPMTVMSFIFNVCLNQQQKLIDRMDESLVRLKQILEK